jgi:hypothetical protein
MKARQKVSKSTVGAVEVFGFLDTGFSAYDTELRPVCQVYKYLYILFAMIELRRIGGQKGA